MTVEAIIWKNEKGEYLVYSERYTHTGRHIDVEYTTNIHEATPTYYLPQSLRDDVVPVPVYVKTVREIKLREKVK